MKKISFDLSHAGIQKAIKEVKAYKKWVQEKEKLLCYKLAVIGAHEASVRFSGAIYDGVNDVDITVKRIDNGYKIIAKGKAVCFIEFGAGVYHNSTEPYPNPRPEGVVGIGEYGKGHGKQQGWYFNRDGEMVFTHGTPAAMPMYYASEEMKSAIEEIAREVFR